MPVAGQETVGKEYSILSNLYVLTERHIDKAAKELDLGVIEAREKVELQVPDGKASFCYPGMESLRVIYVGTPPNSPYHRPSVQLYTDYATSDYLFIAPPLI